MMSKNKTLPAYHIRVETYAEFREHVRKFAKGKYDFIIVIGNTGSGKTETLKEMLGDAPRLEYEGGCPSAYRFYCDGYNCRGGFITLDDLSPKFYKDHNTNSYLKILTNTVPVKTMRWPTNSLDENSDPPNSYETTSRVAVLCNDWATTSEHVRALEGRAICIVFDPPPTEVHYEVARGGWFHDQEIFDWVWEMRRWIVRADMRVYKKLETLKLAGAAWKKIGLEWLIGDEKMRSVYALLTDPTLTSNRQREQKFVALGFGVRSTFYECLREFNRYAPIKADEPPPMLAKPPKPAKPANKKATKPTKKQPQATAKPSMRRSAKGVTLSASVTVKPSD